MTVKYENHTWVDRRDANVISKFPFKPSKAGISI